MDQQTIWFGRSSPQRTWKEPWELFSRAHATFPANPDRTKTYLHFSDNNAPAPNETHKGMICFCMLWIIIQNPDHQFCRVFSLMLSLLSKRRIVYTLYKNTSNERLSVTKRICVLDNYKDSHFLRSRKTKTVHSWLINAYLESSLEY